MKFIYHDKYLSIAGWRASVPVPRKELYRLVKILDRYSQIRTPLIVWLHIGNTTIVISFFGEEKFSIKIGTSTCRMTSLSEEIKMTRDDIIELHNHLYGESWKS